MMRWTIDGLTLSHDVLQVEDMGIRDRTNLENEVGTSCRRVDKVNAKNKEHIGLKFFSKNPEKMLSTGSVCLLTGLKDARFHDQFCTVLSWDETRSRYKVSLHLLERVILVRPSALIYMPRDSCVGALSLNQMKQT